MNQVLVWGLASRECLCGGLCLLRAGGKSQAPGYKAVSTAAEVAAALPAALEPRGVNCSCVKATVRSIVREDVVLVVF